jgi:hypothetical protein
VVQLHFAFVVDTTMTTVDPHQTMSKAETEDLRRNRRKGSYHLVSSKNRLPTDPDEEEEDQLFNYLTTSSNRSLRKTENFLLIQGTKAQLLRELAGSGGDTTSAAFHDILNRLTKIYDPSHFDARKLPSRPSKNSKHQPIQMEGMWIDLSKPKFSDRMGINDNRDYMYTLGRMSFGTYSYFFIAVSATILLAVIAVACRKQIYTSLTSCNVSFNYQRYVSPHQTSV